MNSVANTKGGTGRYREGKGMHLGLDLSVCVSFGPLVGDVLMLRGLGQGFWSKTE